MRAYKTVPIKEIDKCTKVGQCNKCIDFINAVINNAVMPNDRVLVRMLMPLYAHEFLL